MPGQINPTLIPRAVYSVDQSSGIGDVLKGYIGQPDNAHTRAAMASDTVGYLNGQASCGVYETRTGASYPIDSGTVFTNNTVTNEARFTFGGGGFINTTINPEFYASTTCTTDGVLNIVTSGGTATIRINGGDLIRLQQGDTITYSGAAELSTAPSEKELFKDKIRSNLILKPKTRAEVIQNVPENEMVAIETLREVISETEFRKYMKYGFVLVQGKSGDVYQIFRNNAHTKVWRGGTLLEEVCVRLSYGCGAPPTDNVIAFKAMVEADENEFKKLGNVYKMRRAA